MSVSKKSSPLRASPKPTPRITKSERTREAILDAVFKFLWAHPFRDLTVELLMAQTDVGRSAFYQYFQDLHEVMETLLDIMKDEVYLVTRSWFTGVGDPIAFLNDSLAGLVVFGYRRGPIMRAINDAAGADKHLQNAWKKFLDQFDDAVSTRIEVDQEQGLIPKFDARPVAIALNRLDAYTIIEAFGQRPRRKPEPVREALARIWISTLYGSEWIGKESSDLVRT